VNPSGLLFHILSNTTFSLGVSALCCFSSAGLRWFLHSNREVSHLFFLPRFLTVTNLLASDTRHAETYLCKCNATVTHKQSPGGLLFEDNHFAICLAQHGHFKEDTSRIWICVSCTQHRLMGSVIFLLLLQVDTMDPQTIDQLNLVRCGHHIHVSCKHRNGNPSRGLDTQHK
jgi:hypothetical protein